MANKILKGITHFHAETGTEGGYWAFQDSDFIEPPDKEWPHGKWSYEGLHILRNGDHLKVFDKEDISIILWEGDIDLKALKLFTEDAFNFWIHADQNGIDREVWARMFLEEHPAELTLQQD